MFDFEFQAMFHLNSEIPSTNLIIASFLGALGFWLLIGQQRQALLAHPKPRPLIGLRRPDWFLSYAVKVKSSHLLRLRVFVLQCSKCITLRPSPRIPCPDSPLSSTNMHCISSSSLSILIFPLCIPLQLKSKTNNGGSFKSLSDSWVFTDYTRTYRSRILTRYR